MSNVIFDISSYDLFLEKLAFSIPWLLMAVIWTAIVFRLKNKALFYLGCIFVFIGAMTNIYGVYYYYSNKSELLRGDYLIVEGGVEFVENSSTKVLVLSVQGQNFRCVSHSMWIYPEYDDCIKLRGIKRARIYYVPNSEHGYWPARNKVLKIEI